MITLQQYMDCIQYRITNSDEYLWECYGPYARSMDSDELEKYSVNCVFDTVDQTVYEFQAWDYINDRQYRWINPVYIDVVKEESARRNVNHQESIDGKKFIDLNVEKDILEKARAIVRGEEYDTRVIMNIDIDDDLLFTAMKFAHEEDITLNEYLANVLRAEIDKFQS